MKRKRGYWLMKSEPTVYSIDDLATEGRTTWEGVRNYQARNFMMNDMRVGDLVLFYHSSAKPPGVAGVAKVVREAIPDPTQFCSGHAYYDPSATLENPRWFMVEVGFVEAFEAVVGLAQLKSEPKLAGMMVVRKGQRLSVQPVQKGHFRTVLQIAGARTRLR